MLILQVLVLLKNYICKNSGLGLVVYAGFSYSTRIFFSFKLKEKNMELGSEKEKNYNLESKNKNLNSEKDKLNYENTNFKKRIDILEAEKNDLESEFNRKVTEFKTLSAQESNMLKSKETLVK